MSASDAINKTLFHGTHYVFGEGETFTDPGNPSLHNTTFKDPTPRIYLTSDLEEAKDYARNRVEGQDKLFGPVYEVDAPDAVSVSDDIDKNSHLFKGFADVYKEPYKNTYTSTSTTLTPKKVAAWVINPNIDNS